MQSLMSFPCKPSFNERKEEIRTRLLNESTTKENRNRLDSSPQTERRERKKPAPSTPSISTGFAPVIGNLCELPSAARPFVGSAECGSTWLATCG